MIPAMLGTDSTRAECSLGRPGARRSQILAIAARHGARNVRVFGSVARGEDGPESDVDKAKNLRSRVRSYLLEASQANAKTGSLMREAVDLETILVANEHEALALENNLIKQRKPRFNILLRDDKTYPYVKLTLADRYPKVFVTRRLRKDG